MSGKKPPIKLTWFEAATNWLAGLDEDFEKVPRPILPTGVSRPAMASLLGMILRATTSDTNEALVGPRWVEMMTGVNRRASRQALTFLEETGWIHWTQRTRNRVKVYEITIPQVGAIYPHSDLGGDSGGDSGGGYLSHTPGTPGTPVEELNDVVNCLECGKRSGEHVEDCMQREFPSSLEGSEDEKTVPDRDASDRDQLGTVLDAGDVIEILDIDDFGTVRVVCAVCTKSGELVIFRQDPGSWMHFACAPAHWRSSKVVA